MLLMTSRKPFGGAWKVIPGGAGLLALALLATAGGAIALNVSPRLFVGDAIGAAYLSPAVDAPREEYDARRRSFERQKDETDRLLSAIEREVSEWGVSPKQR